MTDRQHMWGTRARRLAVRFGTVAAIGAAVLSGAPSAGADTGDPGRTASMHGRAVQVTYVPTPVRPLGDALGATQATAINPNVTPYAMYVTDKNWEYCEDYQVCIWREDGYKGPGYFFGGDYAPCEGWRFEGTAIQDHTWSIWSRSSGPISIWDRYADGTYRYNKYGWLPREYSHEKKFSYIMDAWVYDPGNNCTSLVLHYPSDA
ncbi:peptidase inhibitor family I36 protein [Flindersiella endophytica]